MPLSQGGADPRNPSDEIFAGRSIPLVPAAAVTGRRDFTIPVRPTLHYRDGIDGAAETVTVNERRITAEDGTDVPYVEGAANLKYGPTQSIELDFDHGCFGAVQPKGREGATGGPNEERTLNGAIIYGT